MAVSSFNSIRTRVAAAMLAIFFVSIWSLSYFTSLMLKKDMERLLGSQQVSTVSMLAANVNQELTVRLEALKTVAATMGPDVIGNATALQILLKDRPVLHGFFTGGVVVYRTDGVAIADIPLSAHRMGTSGLGDDSVSLALRQGSPTIGQPFMDKTLSAPVFGMAVPIHDGRGRVVGALSGVTDLSKPCFLDSLLESRYGKTGGYVLVSPQHRMVVTASDKSRIMEVLPVPGTHPLLDRFISGDEGYGLGMSPLGVDVLASVKRVPLAGWYVAAVLSTEEAFAPVYAMQQHMLLATLVLTLLAGALAWWMLKRQLAPMLGAAQMLATMSQADHPPQPLPIVRYDEIGQLISGFNHLLKTLAQRDQVAKDNEEALRIAAVAFESQVGIVVADANHRFLRVNRAFTQITGYGPMQTQGESVALLRSDQHSPAFYDTVWRDAKHLGIWQGDMWIRCKNGTDCPARISISAVKDDVGQVTHYVGNLTDATDSQQQEQQRLHHEAEHRDALVREVHHRIKNNLQGITGMLRQFAQKHPEIAEPMQQAIGQVRGISVIHGLQGRASPSKVRLCELTGAIAEGVQDLWQTPIVIDIPDGWQPRTIIESEAVPIALVLNELILNAVKHGGRAVGHVGITLREGAQADAVQISIRNAGSLANTAAPTGAPPCGLQLVSALMPHHGAHVLTAQYGGDVVTVLEFAPPVIFLELKEPT
jgi:PAS domain S-box-containing protein